jgi:putative nucleotidyltransferase with HDIG domain
MKLFNFIRKNNKTIWLNLIFLLGIAVIVYLFPREGKFKYEFQKGSPWMHEVLLAPFDFPIYKTEARLQAEKDTLLKDFEPYFQLDTFVQRKVFSDYEEIFSKQWDDYIIYTKNLNQKVFKKNSASYNPDSVKRAYFSAIRVPLLAVYNQGIILEPVQLQKVQNKELMINIISGQVVRKAQVKSVFSQKTSYEYLRKSITEIAEVIQPVIRSENRFDSFFDPIDLVEPNLFYDEVFSKKMESNLLSEISLTEGMIHTGEKIIAIGEPINDEKYQILQSLKREYETNPDVSRNYNLIFLGQIILVAFAFIVLYLFLYNFRPEVLDSGSKTFFIIMIVVGMAFLATLTIRAESINLFVVPFVILPIIVKTFYDARLALFVHLITILLIGFWAPNGFEFVFMNFIAGVVTIFTLRNMYRRGVLFVAAVFTLISYSLVYSGIALLQEGRIENIDVKNYAWFAGNALLVLSSYPLIYIFEKLFGFISDATLVELSDTNQPLLRILAQTAPGTFQHSLQVANLAEEAALSVNANPLLVRTGALYHDIGKMEDPFYFIENQTSNYNPHDQLEFEQSAKIIIGHVSKGIEIARKHKVPEVIVDFIRTHHGSTTVQYFYKSYLKKYPDQDVDIQNFKYPGPEPFSKETAILMMADSTEAASRSLKNINEEVIDNLVDSIIDSQWKENQFNNVNLTLRDFTVIREIFKKKLLNIYHARIEYPK